MAEIELTIRADEDDLRQVAGTYISVTNCPSPWDRVRTAIAAALPRPRIQVRPGMVLRRNSDGSRWGGRLTRDQNGRAVVVAECLTVDQPWRTDGLDPAEWQVILDAEDPS